MTEDQTLMDEAALASKLKISKSLLRKWRRLGIGPKWLKLGGKTVRYRSSDLHEWLQTCETETAA